MRINANFAEKMRIENAKGQWLNKLDILGACSYMKCIHEFEIRDSTPKIQFDAGT